MTIEVKKTDRELCGLISNLAKRIEAHIREVSEQLKLTAPQAVAIRELTEPMTISELANRMCYEPSNITTVIDGLESLQYIQRIPHKTDRRAKIITLTKSGILQRDILLQKLLVNSPLENLTTANMMYLKNIFEDALSN